MPHEVEHEEEYEGEDEKSGVPFHASPEEEELERDAGPGPLKRLALKKARCETSLLSLALLMFYFFFILRWSKKARAGVQLHYASPLELVALP